MTCYQLVLLSKFFFLFFLHYLPLYIHIVCKKQTNKPTTKKRIVLRVVYALYKSPSFIMIIMIIMLAKLTVHCREL